MKRNALMNPKKALAEFFDLIVNIISEGTSDNYAVMVMTQYISNKSHEYPFVKSIHLSKNGTVVDDAIMNINQQDMSTFLTELMDSLFSKLFKHLIKNKMTKELHNEMKALGVDF
jgi:DNA-binding ferritin-like protein (Dps family)